MDYLARDSHAAGVAYGTYDKERLFKSVLCVRSVEDVHSYRLGWRESGLRAVEHFVCARFQMFSQHYYHKTNHAVMVMLQEIANEGRNLRHSVMDTGLLNALVSGYTILSDEAFLLLLTGDPRPHFPLPGNKTITYLARRIQERRLYKRVYEFRRDEVERAEGFLEALRPDFPGMHFTIHQMPLKATKDLDRGASLLYLNGDNRYERDPLRGDWLTASPILRALRDEERTTVRLFADPGNEEGAAEPIRLAALRLSRSFFTPPE
jgi:hypothetical protein